MCWACMDVILWHVVAAVSSTEKLCVVQLRHMEKKKKKKRRAVDYSHTYCFTNVRREKTQKHKRSHHTYLHYFVHSELIRS